MKLDANTMMKSPRLMTAFINGLSLLKIPLLAFCTPRVIVLDHERSEVRIGLGWRTRNHLGVMYFGALAMGAELSIALKAVEEIQRSGMRIDFLFQDFKADFRRRADGDVNFICLEAAQVAALVEKAKNSDERHAAHFKGAAYVVGKPDEPVMTYELTLTMKRRVKKPKNTEV